ncbi:MAG: hypothetical protein A2169_09550 [Deltaproteobacteria bacterium RBG_13_47_9]|nr:MAG: hypothetical protein A2169_09550 [Deltaproteobacteria bacterium RBG_13_47_9]
MVSGLNQLPAFLPFLTKEILQPFNAPRKDIVNKAEAILIAFNSRRLLLWRLPLWQFMNRNLIFPLDHNFFSKLRLYISIPPRGIKCEMNVKIQTKVKALARI